MEMGRRSGCRSDRSLSEAHLSSSSTALQVLPDMLGVCGDLASNARAGTRIPVGSMEVATLQPVLERGLRPSSTETEAGGVRVRVAR